MRENLHNRAIPKEVLEQIMVKANEINELLAPYAVALSAKERRSLLKMGEKTVSFVEKAYELAAANPDLCPTFLNISDFDADLKDAVGLLVAENTAQQIFNTIGDVKMLAGSEAYKSALAFYNYIKLSAEQDIPRARAIYEELRKRFPQKGRQSEE